MTTELVWEGHRISIETRLASRYLWTATETTLRVDGQAVAHSGGFRMTEHSSGQFPHQDRLANLELEVKGDWFSWTSGKYRLCIDGQEVAQGSQGISGLLPGYLMIVLAMTFVCCGGFTLLMMLSERVP